MFPKFNFCAKKLLLRQTISPTLWLISRGFRFGCGLIAVNPLISISIFLPIGVGPGFLQSLRLLSGKIRRGINFAATGLLEQHSGYGPDFASAPGQ
jgi:hypothetical protein